MNSVYFSFYRSTVLSSRAVDDHLMYLGGSVVSLRKVPTIGIKISPYPCPNFHRRGGGKKCEIWRRLKYYTIVSSRRLKMQQDILNLKQISCAGMIALYLCQVW